MRWLEVRRHSLTKKGPARGRGSHLSARGVALARAVGEHLGPFAYVVTSPAPRAIETAIAMGFAVDDTLDLPSGYVPGQASHHDQWNWPRPHLTYARLIHSSQDVAAATQAHRAHWARAAQAVPQGAAALVISHGGTIEPALVACLPSADHRSWRPPFSHCDGARLGFDNGQFVTVQFHRAPALPQ
jgi:broad specificity phosphatase PhoE